MGLLREVVEKSSTRLTGDGEEDGAAAFAQGRSGMYLRLEGFQLMTRRAAGLKVDEMRCVIHSRRKA